MIRYLYIPLIFTLMIHHLDAQDLSYARRVVEDLAGNAMHGRGFTYHGINKAAKYIIKEYKRNGVLPAGDNYSQWFHVSINTFPGAVTCSIGNKMLRAGTDFLPDPSSPGIKGSFGLVVINTNDILAGNGISIIQKASRDQLLCLDISNMDSLDKNRKTTVSEFRDYLKQSALIKAAGVLEVTGQKLRWNSSGSFLNKPWIIVNSAIHVDSLSQVKVAFKNRFWPAKKTRNIMGYCRGTLKPDSFILLVAHYDHIGSLGKETFFPGANDNASGVAMLLNLMEYYTSHPPAYSLLFLAPSAEELGLIGSRNYVEDPVVDHKKVRFLINFDLVGTGEEGIMVVNGSVFPRELEKLVSINRADSLLPFINTRGEACNSDHCPFYLKGIPCFFIYTLGGNTSYHDPFDTPDAISMVAFENYARLMIRFIEEL